MGCTMYDRDATYLALMRVTQDVVLRFADTLAEPAGDVIMLPSEECLLGRTYFTGAFAGIVSVAAPVGLCRMIAAGVLDPGCSDAELARCTPHALAELANVIAGGLISALGDERDIALAVPVIGYSSYHDWVVMSCARHTVRLTVGDWPLLASFLPSTA